MALSIVKHALAQAAAPAGEIYNPALPNTYKTITGTDYTQRLISAAVSFGFVVGVMIFVFIFITGAIRWLTSAGDKGHLESAQKQLTSGLVGLAILFCLYAIIKLINSVFGVDLFILKIPTLGL